MASILRHVTDNWKLKTLAFALAVLLWVVVSSEQVTSNWIRLPLQIQITDDDFEIAGVDTPSEVQVLFTGPGRDLLDLALRRPPLRLNVSNVDEPIENVALDPRMVQVPVQIAVNALEVRPAFVQLEFTRMETRSVPVSVNVVSDLGSEWAVADSLVVEPASIEVQGPVDRVQALAGIPTEPVRLTPEDTVFSRAVAIDTTQLRGLDLSARSVRVQGRIDRVIQRTLQNVPVDVGEGVGIVPREVEVVLRGPASTVSRLTVDRFRVVVSIGEIPARIPPEGFPVPLRIAGLVAGVEATVNPGTVRLLPRPAIDTIPAAAGATPADTTSANGQDGG